MCGVKPGRLNNLTEWLQVLSSTVGTCCVFCDTVLILVCIFAVGHLGRLLQMLALHGHMPASKSYYAEEGNCLANFPWWIWQEMRGVQTHLVLTGRHEWKVQKSIRACWLWRWAIAPGANSANPHMDSVQFWGYLFCFFPMQGKRTAKKSLV